MAVPRSPLGSGPAGRGLWRAVLGAYELAEHEMVLLRQACRVADTCDQLQAVLDAEGLMVAGRWGPRPHPMLSELRSQRLVLARLIVALRVPLGAEEAAGPRGQVRALRGVYGGAS